MTKKAITTIILIGIVLILINSNPTKDEFVEWASIQLKEQSNSDLEELFNKALAKPVLLATTTRRDYTIFSIFVIESPEKTTRYLGIFSQFIRIK